MRFRKQSESCTWAELRKDLPAMVIGSWVMWIVFGAFTGRFSMTDSLIGLVMAASGLIPVTLFFATTRRSDSSVFAWFPVMFARDVTGDRTLSLCFSAWACSTFTVLIIGLGIRLLSQWRSKKRSRRDPSPLWDAQTDGI